MHFLGACASAFGLGFVYFISAVPVAAAMGLPTWVAAAFAWAGYSTGALVVAFAGEPLRAWLTKRLNIRSNPENPNLVMRAWNRYGLSALGVLAPVTVGPQAGALLAIALGAKRTPVVAAIAFGAIPWAVAFAILTSLGIKLVK
jgi:hypothetical protein